MVGEWGKRRKSQREKGKGLDVDGSTAFSQDSPQITKGKEKVVKVRYASKDPSEATNYAENNQMINGKLYLLMN